MHQITVSNISIDIVRKDIKNMHLAVYPPTGRVRIAVPLRVNDEAVRLFAIAKLGWIKRHQRAFEKQERLSPREFKERESHYFQGQRYLLRMRTDAAKSVDLQGKYLNLRVKEGATPDHKKSILTEWYRSQLKRILPAMIAHWEKKLGVTVRYWGVKQMKTKWGSCNVEKNRLWFNLELAKKPTSCLEYIVVHEMVHLLERHHNDKFRAHMDYYLPHWKQRRDELNRLPISHADWDY